MAASSPLGKEVSPEYPLVGLSMIIFYFQPLVLVTALVEACLYDYLINPFHNLKVLYRVTAHCLLPRKKNSHHA